MAWPGGMLPTPLLPLLLPMPGLPLPPLLLAVSLLVVLSTQLVALLEPSALALAMLAGGHLPR